MFENPNNSEITLLLWIIALKLELLSLKLLLYYLKCYRCVNLT